MKKDGITDVELVLPGVYDGDGRWDFTFRHWLTGVEKKLGMHGLTDQELKKYIFGARVCWDGGSSSTPELKDFLKPGYEICIRPEVPR